MNNQLAIIEKYLEHLEDTDFNAQMEDLLLKQREQLLRQRDAFLSENSTAREDNEMSPVHEQSKFQSTHCTKRTDPLRSVQPVPSRPTRSNSDSVLRLAADKIFPKKPLTPKNNSPTASRYSHSESEAKTTEQSSEPRMTLRPGLSETSSDSLYCPFGSSQESCGSAATVKGVRSPKRVRGKEAARPPISPKGRFRGRLGSNPFKSPQKTSLRKRFGIED